MPGSLELIHGYLECLNMYFRNYFSEYDKNSTSFSIDVFMYGPSCYDVRKCHHMKVQKRDVPNTPNPAPRI